MATVMPVSEGSALAEAAETLSGGRAVCIPTDTVYGLAASVSRPASVSELFALKGRPRDVVLPVLVAGTEQALGLVPSMTGAAAKLAGRYWPGALTLVLPRRRGLSASLGGDGTTVGVRCPDHHVPLALCRLVGPLATTSANLHGAPTPVVAQGVADLFGERLALVLDGGACDGSSSTVVDCTGRDSKCLRDGRIPWSEVLGALEEPA
ncbi:MAG: L-threonylcarbamoyladenylate synthase [Thermoplasmata archaeon]